MKKVSINALIRKGLQHGCSMDDIHDMYLREEYLERTGKTGIGAFAGTRLMPMSEVVRYFKFTTEWDQLEQIWSDQLKKEQIRQKIRVMDGNKLEVMVNEALKDYGMEYRIYKQQNRCVVYVKLTPILQVGFCISYKKIDEGVESLKEQVERLQVMQAGSCPIIKAGIPSKSAKWKKSVKQE